MLSACSFIVSDYRRASLRDCQPRKSFFLTSIANKIIFLLWSGPAPTTNQASVCTALLRFATCPTARPPGTSETALLKDCYSRGITQLELRTFGALNVGAFCGRGFASYSDDAMEDILRFGTWDAWNVPCLIQGHASLLDCVLQAEDIFGENWIIMANS